MISNEFCDGRGKSKVNHDISDFMDRHFCRSILWMEVAE